MPASDNLIRVDGSTDFSGGVDSIKVTTIASDSNPGGLARNQLAWLANGTVRDGGITPRFGRQPKGVVHDGTALFQGFALYEPLFGNPYFLVQIGGHIWMVDPDFNFHPRDLSAQFGVFHPATVPLNFMVQAEEFMVIQAGDFGKVAVPTLPLIWDGNVLRRSLGIIGPNNVPGGITPYNEIPAAGPMDYYQQRLWYAQGRTVTAGDVVGDQQSGSAAPYNFRDSVLKVTENPLALQGDGFTVPSQQGNITAVTHSANLDATLGQGNLFLGTTRAIYSLQVPPTRTAWIAATANNQPLMTVVQINNGMVNSRSVVRVNGDLYFQSLEPSIRSLQQSLRYFGMPGNTQISANENRILEFNDRSLMAFSTGIEFDNRLLQAVLPKQLPQGVIHQAILPLDFEPVSSFNKPLSPVWEGHWEGWQDLQLVSGDFGGLQRAFSMVVSEIDSSIQLWELTTSQRFDNQDSQGDGDRVTMQIEFPAFNWNRPFDMNKLVSAEIWVDKLFGDVDFTLEYRPDGDVCWHLWHKWKECVPKTSCDPLVSALTAAQGCYPLTTYRESFRSTMTIPLPPLDCQQTSGRPMDTAYQIQPRLTIKGWTRVRGLLLSGVDVMRQLYDSLVCSVDNSPNPRAKKSISPLPPIPPQPPPPLPPGGTVFGDRDTGVVYGNPNTGQVFGIPSP